jgi:hypothetical protein
MLISDEYRALNAELHRSSPAYGTSSAEWANRVNELCQAHQIKTALDYGCGKGTLSKSLPRSRPYRMAGYDPAIPGQDTLPARAELVICTDVLEHVEPECLSNVLTHIDGLAERFIFFVIHTGPAKKVLPDGRNAHMLIEPAWWWMRQISDRWTVRTFGGTGVELACLGAARVKESIK